ncbi:thioesterase II family protein [Promicromonospora xylanilytica]
MTCLRPVDDGTAWVFLPFAGGNGDWYYPWLRLLPPGDGIWTVNLPGRARRPLDHAETDPVRVVAELVGALDDVPGRPVLFGHSLGGSLAHAVAYAAERAGREIGLVAVSAATPPDGRGGTGDLDDRTLIAQLTDLGGTPPEVLAYPELLEIILPALRADLLLAAALRPAGRVRAPLLALAGTDDVAAPASQVAAWAEHAEDWQGLTELPGGHFFLEQHAAQVVEVVRRTARRTSADLRH